MHSQSYFIIFLWVCHDAFVHLACLVLNHMSPNTLCEHLGYTTHSMPCPKFPPAARCVTSMPARITSHHIKS
ncbi:hypothetical protein IQ07DRAFT_256113 [Pyrenochaeta sp. DS3sAY3a]|nr:hypothetical protein IQ07DRAFT_256113 [Pyrenochaeta sp. DS3sAY3a]